MKTFTQICWIAGALFLIALTIHLDHNNNSLKQENKTLKQDIKSLNEALDIAINMYPKPETNEDSNNIIYTPPIQKYSLKIGDKFPLQSPIITAQKGVTVTLKIEGSFSTSEDLQSLLDNKEWVVTFEPGGYSRREQFTYSSPDGATIHVDGLDNITQLTGTIHRQ